MADLAVLAAGFGAIPLASILLYSFRAWLDAHREVVWGGFAGVIAFLGLSHAMAFVLEGKPFLFAGNDSLGAASFLLTGLALGGLLGWFLFEGPLIRTEPASIVWATAAFLALHSFGDGLDWKSTRLNSSHLVISYAVFCLKKKNIKLPLSMPLSIG